MTEAMKCYFDQVIMDLDFAQMNADQDWEYRQFLEEVKDEVSRRQGLPAPEAPGPVEDETGDALSTAEEVITHGSEGEPPPGPPSPPPPPKGRKVG